MQWLRTTPGVAEYTVGATLMPTLQGMTTVMMSSLELSILKTDTTGHRHQTLNFISMIDIFLKGH